MSEELQKAILEKLANLEHDQWSEFIQYLIGFGDIHGELTAKEFWRNYDMLSKTPYSELSEKQKESDRKFARKSIEVFTEFLADKIVIPRKQLSDLLSQKRKEWKTAYPLKSQQDFNYRVLIDGIFDELVKELVEGKTEGQK